MNSRAIIFIVGPTAVGKSAVALSLTKKIKAEIISCDSMQIYKEISVASNKPTEKERDKAPHHLIDVVSVEEEFDVALFYKLVLEAVKKIHRKAAVPVIVGGSGLYMQILLDGIFKGDNKDERLRARLEQEAATHGVEGLYKRLSELDPVAAAKIHPRDLRRITRALEVCAATNKPISRLQQEREGLWKKYHVRIFGLRQERETLYSRINDRVEEMFRKGLVKEIKKLQGRNLSLTARHLIGIKEVLSFSRGDIGLEEAKEQIQQNTRRLAKKQMTWFRKEKRIEWLDLTDDSSPDALAGEIMKRMGYVKDGAQA